MNKTAFNVLCTIGLCSIIYGMLVLSNTNTCSNIVCWMVAFFMVLGGVFLGFILGFLARGKGIVP